jgi:putative transposase
LIGTPDRQQVVALVEEAVDGGCRRVQACSALEISLRTYKRWMRDGDSDNAKVDGRKGSRRVAPANKLSEDERRQILAIANSPEFASSPPSQIGPTLADRGEYLASESTVYRISKDAKQQHHRGRARKPSTRVVTSYCATEPNRTACGHGTLPGCRPA